ncbi:RDD family protein [Vibrio sp. V27_P1S3P104]|uniref:RDD family protein n=1 Tax=unclassified Vibrio TaxID=2614977 RepID=UPI001372C533|nr:MULTISPECIES: RDD family protein [unclassified Vibrio]NAW68120.1 RDD family protein [Vibrio sp. V28_P6S34P95]NAX05660.1 RDD family protein [Vibrio sp. V30_P3S12P165]NAX33252.1 RDD family protein [Vibrio sp. V29_P1S30P107]NAX38200.1 RDD family protein [Vibrio sp. V27_P1S3P104]NAX40855.1 RDD family protein [Vibrio sp. V26_P1S5P106]
MNTSNLPPAGLFRRLGALLYDSLIIMAILMIAGGVVIAALEALVALNVMSYSPYQDAGELLSHDPIWSPLYTLYLATTWIYFFVFFWTRAGQTLGMRAWKIMLRNADGSLISSTQALIRLATSVFGLGNLIVLIDPQKRSFQDMWAKTEVVRLDTTR